MAATIFTGKSAWTVSGRVFRLLLEAARSADANPASRFTMLIEVFDNLQGINLDQLDDLTRADVIEALLKGTTAILDRLQADAGELITGISADSLREAFNELDQMLNTTATGLYPG